MEGMEGNELKLLSSLGRPDGGLQGSIPCALFKNAKIKK